MSVRARTESRINLDGGQGYHIQVIAKEKVKNSWDILNAILDHKYHQNHSDKVISSE